MTRRGVMELLAGVALLVLCASPAWAVSSAGIVNGGFETGDFTGWTATTGFGNVSVVSGQAIEGVEFTPHEGVYMAMIGSNAPGPNYNMLNQVIQLTPAVGSFSFWYNFWSSDYDPYDRNAFQVLVNGVSVFSLDAGDVDKAPESFGYTGWTRQVIRLSDVFDVVPGGTISIGFMAGDTGDMALHSGAFIDSVRAVPLPASALLLLVGLLGVTGFKARRSR